MTEYYDDNVFNTEIYNDMNDIEDIEDIESSHILLNIPFIRFDKLIKLKEYVSTFKPVDCYDLICAPNTLLFLNIIKKKTYNKITTGIKHAYEHNKSNTSVGLLPHKTIRILNTWINENKNEYDQNNTNNTNIIRYTLPFREAYEKIFENILVLNNEMYTIIILHHLFKPITHQVILYRLDSKIILIDPTIPDCFTTQLQIEKYLNNLNEFECSLFFHEYPINYSKVHVLGGSNIFNISKKVNPIKRIRYKRTNKKICI